MGKLPSVLMIQLNRFALTEEGQPLKVNSRCEFSTDLTVKGEQFELYGILVHTGSVDCGHYFSYARSREGDWFKFNDKVVSQVSLDVALRVGMGGYTSTFQQGSFAAPEDNADMLPFYEIQEPIKT